MENVQELYRDIFETLSFPGPFSFLHYSHGFSIVRSIEIVLISLISDLNSSQAGMCNPGHFSRL